MTSRMRVSRRVGNIRVWELSLFTSMQSASLSTVSASTSSSAPATSSRVFILGPDWPFLLVTFLVLAGAPFSVLIYGLSNPTVGDVSVLLLSTFGVCGLLFSTALLDPGLLALNKHSLSTNVRNREEEGESVLMSNLRQSAASNVLTVTSEDDGVPEEYCDICRLDQPPLTSHCRTCNTCIMKHDHHCPWIGTCVGARNAWTFHAFFVAVVLHMVVCATIYRAHLPAAPLE